MADKIQLIWDFRGRTAQGTAEHQRRHLAEFARREHVEISGTGAEALSESHWIAWMVVDGADVERLRAALRPNRGLPAQK